MHSRPVQFITLQVALLAALTGAGCSDAGAPTDPGSQSTARPNLLLVTLDTTRVDRLGAYGHLAAQTPRLDELADRGLRFERAYAHAPLTLPTHASLFTGTFPPEHGIHDNGRNALGEQLTTLAEIFSARGFSTGAFVSAIALDGSFGLDRGFDIYDDDLGSMGPGGTRLLDRPASEVVDSALSWLATCKSPFFAWVHFYDPHADYSPPADFTLEDPYDGEIAYVDAQLGRLLGWLESRRLAKETLIVVIADHGESLGEKGEHTHASLIYEGTQHIPWVMTWPGQIVAGSRSDDLVQQVDLLPTLMELYDWSVPEAASGRSLVPLLRGDSLEPAPIYVESEYCALNFGWSPLRGIIEGNWKYIDAPTPELYDLSSDPGETQNLAESAAEVAARLQGRLRALLDSMESYAPAAVVLEEGMSEGLSDLGYVQGAGEISLDASGLLINPIERIEYLELYHAAVGMANHGRFAEMIEPLEQVVSACPESAGFRALLGDAYRRLERWDQAREQLEAALEIAPSYDPAHFYLAAFHETRGELDPALASYRENLRLRPEYVPAREGVARILAEQEDLSAALTEYQEIVRLDPNQARHWITIAGLEQRVGNTARRKQAIERSLELADGDLSTRDYCAWVLATASDDELRDGERALALAQELVEETGGRVPRLLDTLAAAQAETGSFSAAITNAEKAIELADALQDPLLMEQTAAHLELYRGGKPVRED